MSISSTVKNYIPQYSDEGITEPLIATFIDTSLAVFSRHFPRLLISQETVASTNTSYEFSLPTSWEDDFSRIQYIEYPIGENPPTYLEEEDFQIYFSPTTSDNKLLFIDYIPVEDYAIVFTGTWTEDTISSYNADSVALLATSMVCDVLAAKFAGGTDDLVQADVVNWRTKSRDYTDAKRNFTQLFCMRTGVGEKNLAPAGFITYSTLSSGKTSLDRNTLRNVD